VWRQNRYHAIQQLRFKLIKLIFCSKNCDDETGDRHSSARHTLSANTPLPWLRKMHGRSWPRKISWVKDFQCFTTETRYSCTTGTSASI
jgi:hypothetical protein